MGFSHVFSPDGLNNTLLSQGCIPKAAPSMGELSIHSKDRGGVKPPIAWIQLTG